MFAWNKVTFQCPSIRYVITAVNCGICPNATNDTRVFCIHFNTSTHTLYNMCTFAVKTETCGLLLGEKSNIVSLNLVGK